MGIGLAPTLNICLQEASLFWYAMKRELGNNVSERPTISIFRDGDKAAREETVEML
jgi:hypothetical protein